MRQFEVQTQWPLCFPHTGKWGIFKIFGLTKNVTRSGGDQLVPGRFPWRSQVKSLPEKQAADRRLEIIKHRVEAGDQDQREDGRE